MYAKVFATGGLGMIGLLSETRITLADLSRRERVDFSTVYRWTRRGFDGVRLESFMVGHRRFTTEEAFHRFVEKLNADRDKSDLAVAAGTA